MAILFGLLTAIPPQADTRRDEDMHPTTHFRYKTLADPKEHFRLIEVHSPDGLSRTPSISIFESVIRHAPPNFELPSYDAISYTWGDERDEEVIHVRHRNSLDNNRVEALVVRKNCADVLRQLTKFGTSKYYWIDAICINQANKSEREEQVVLMSYIFGRARCVLACVGAHQHDSDFLAHTLKGFDKFLAAHQVSIDVLTLRASRSGQIPRIACSGFADSAEDICLQRCFAWIEQMESSSFERFFKALDQFARRPYFWRIWILQEICLADQLRFLCGNSELHLSTLLFWWRDARIMALNHSVSIGNLSTTAKMTRLVMSKLGPTYIREVLWKDRHYLFEHGGSGLGTAFENMLHERQVVRLNAQDYNRRLMAIPDVLRMCEYRQCQDPRDCVFGTLALGNWRPSVSLCKGGHHVNTGETVRPNYKTSAFNLAKLLLPGFHDVLQLNRLVMGMLGLNHSTAEVQAGLLSRHGQLPDLTSFRSMPPLRICNEAQKLVHVVEGGIRLTPESSWSVVRQAANSYQYTRVLSAEGRCYAVTSVPIEPGDWLVPTHYGRGFVLRRCGALYAVVGKAYCPPELWPEELQLTAFMMWYDPDDLLVHLVGGLRGLATDKIDPPTEEMIEHLNVGLCATGTSSFGQLPSRKRVFPASEFAFDTLGICEMIVKDCYEDNNHYWFC